MDPITYLSTMFLLLLVLYLTKVTGMCRTSVLMCLCSVHTNQYRIIMNRNESIQNNSDESVHSLRTRASECIVVMDI